MEVQRGFGRCVNGDWLKYLQQVPMPSLVARKLPNLPMYCSAFKVRAAVVSGTGKLHVFGPVQDDFRKSALVGLACLRSHWDTVEALLLQHKTPADRNSIRHTAFQCDVHLSPLTFDNAIGSGSAGVGIALTLLWVFTGMSLRQDTAVTGALTLGGKVLPVGGVGEKRAVAAAVGMTRLVVPKANRDEQAAAQDKKKKKKRKRLSKEEEAAAGVELIGVETLWEAVRACMAGVWHWG
jgi:ATP-dependent Lon protease